MKGKIARINLIILILSATLSILWSNNQNGSAQLYDNFLLYQNSNYGINIEYPSNWDLYNYQAGSFQPLNQAGDPSVTIFVFNQGQVPYFPSRNISLSEIVNLRLENEQNLESNAIVDMDFNLINKRETILSNYPSYEILYIVKEFSIFDDYLKILEIWTKVDDKVYVVEYKADLPFYNNYLPVVSHMIESIEINPSTTSSDSSDSKYILYVIGFLIFVFIIIFAVYKIKRRLSKRKRVKYVERRGFSDSDKNEILHRQKNLCAHCKRFLSVRDFDHIDGDRSNNDISNCQALCPNCHAIKTRRGIIEHRKSGNTIVRKILKFILGFFLLIIMVYILFLFF
ncbi:MAG: PsbP-related protein [Candidatus Nitrosocosmicus sp.]